MRGKQGGSEGGGDDDGMSAHNHRLHGPVLPYWRKRKLPIDGDIIADVSWRVGRLEEEWKTLYMGLK